MEGGEAHSGVYESGPSLDLYANLFLWFPFFSSYAETWKAYFFD